MTWLISSTFCHIVVILLYKSIFAPVLFPVFENKERIVLVMDYACGGELYDFINERKGLYEDQARKFFRQIVSAVYYLHVVSDDFSLSCSINDNSW